MERNKLLSSIPKVDEVIEWCDLKRIQEDIPRTILIESIREVLNDVREFILNCSSENLEDFNIEIGEIAKEVINKIKKKNKRHLQRMINASGVIIHTNLGRSILSYDAAKAVMDVCTNYSNLEYDIENGERGSRYSHIEGIVSRVTGAEAAMVVNNNAAAVLLVLNTLCNNKEAIVSRGELVEIGGSFRIPEVMTLSGAKLVEVGTTNKTHLYDYEKAINENTGVLMKVHTSNYRIMGFVESVGDKEIAELSKEYDVPVVEDIGSGTLIDFSKYGLSYEPTVQEAIKNDIDVLTFSGDKMLGGPQAGIIVGKKKYIDMMKKNQLARALRVDKMTIAALEATLRQYLSEEKAVENIPTLRMMVESIEDIEDKAKILLGIIKSAMGDNGQVDIVNEYSQVGGGSMPLEKLPTFAISLKPCYATVNDLEETLRKAEVPVIVRIWRDNILFDVRTIERDDFDLIGKILENSFGRRL